MKGEDQGTLFHLGRRGASADLCGTVETWVMDPSTITQQQRGNRIY